MLTERALALGLAGERRLALAALRPVPPRCRRAAPGGRFASAEALALYRVNALDAGVKGVLEHGLGARGDGIS